jgi:hypothetical protein
MAYGSSVQNDLDSLWLTFFYLPSNHFRPSVGSLPELGPLQPVPRDVQTTWRRSDTPAPREVLTWHTLRAPQTISCNPERERERERERWAGA